MQGGDAPWLIPVGKGGDVEYGRILALGQWTSYLLTTMPIDPPNPFAAPETGADALTADVVSGELAGRGTRLVAAIIDMLKTAGAIIDNIILVGIVFGGLFAVGMSPFIQDNTTKVTLGVSSVVTSLLINGWLLHTRGQSVGKMLMKIRIVRVDQVPTTGMDTIVKRILPIGLASLIPIVGSFIGLIDALFIFRQDRRTLHDLIAGTEVVTVKT